MEVIKKIPQVFCSSSGQKVDHSKLRIFFSNNVHWQVREQIANDIGFSRTDDLGKYLGVPTLYKRANKQSYQFIFDKVAQQLSSWKARNLSLAGKVTLTKSVFQALPSYVMQTACLPSSVCEEVDKLCHGFIWGDTENQKRVHLVAWDDIC